MSNVREPKELKKKKKEKSKQTKKQTCNAFSNSRGVYPAQKLSCSNHHAIQRVTIKTSTILQSIIHCVIQPVPFLALSRSFQFWVAGEEVRECVDD